MKEELPHCRVCHSLLEPGANSCYVCTAEVGVGVRKLRRIAYSVWLGKNVVLVLWAVSAAMIGLSLLAISAVILLWVVGLFGGLILLLCAEKSRSNRLFGASMVNLCPIGVAAALSNLFGLDRDGHIQVVSLMAGCVAFLLNCTYAGRAWRRPMQEYAHRECRKCGYPLWGLEGDVCPECGEPSRVIWKIKAPGTKTEKAPASRSPRAQIKQ